MLFDKTFFLVNALKSAININLMNIHYLAEVGNRTRGRPEGSLFNSYYTTA